MDGAPILANSAVTPAFRRATSSMKAGGKDHSRPTRRPTVFVMLSVTDVECSSLSERVIPSGAGSSELDLAQARVGRSPSR